MSECNKKLIQMLGFDSRQKSMAEYTRLVIELCMLTILGLTVGLAEGQNSDSNRNPLIGDDSNFTPAVTGEQRKRILILHSYQPKSNKDEITDIVISDLKRRFEDIDLYIEYMDTKRFNPELAYLDGLAELYQTKYSNMSFDVILCSDNDALNFMVTRGPELFSDAPVVFMGIDNFTKEMLEGKTNFTGVVKMLNMKKMVRVPLQILPKTQRIVVIHDETSTGQAIMNQFFSQSVPEEFPNREFIYLSGADFTYQEMFDRVGKLSHDSIILLMGFAHDRLGQHLSQEDHRPRLSKASPVPVFADSKYDCIGGLESCKEKQGVLVADQVARILEGESVDSVPILYEDMSELTFNYEQLKRFAIPFSRLPQGSIIINEPVSFYYRHKKLIFSVSGFILMLIVIIMILAINILRRRHAEDALQESEERLSKAFQSNPNLMGIFDLDEKRRLLINDSFTRITGYTLKEATGTTLDELNFWIDQDKLMEALRLIKQHHVLKDYEIDIRTKQGKIRTLRYNGATLDIPDKNLAMFSAQDITEQKKVQQDMRQYEHLVTSSTDMLALLDAQYVYLAANQAYAEAFQRSQVDLVGHTVSEVFGDEFVDKTIRPNAEQCLAGEEVHYQAWFEFPAHGRRYMDISYFPYADENGLVRGFAVHGRNITEQKKAKLAFEAEKKFAENAINAQLDTFFVFNPETGKAVMWNKSFSKISEYSDEEIAAMKAPDDWYDPEDLKKAATTITQIDKQGASTVEIALITKNGKKIPFEYRASLLKIEGGQPLIISIGRDITERKKAEQKLRSVNQQLSASEQQLKASFQQLQISEKKYRSLIANIPGVVWTSDQNGNTPFISANIENIYGYKPDEIYQNGENLWFGRIHPEDVEKATKAYANVFEKAEPLDIEYRIKRKDGKWIWLNDRSIGAYEIDGVKYADGVFFDITEDKKVRDDLRQSEEKFSKAFHASPNPMCISTIEQGRFLEVNDAFVRSLGFTRDEIIGNTSRKLGLWKDPAFREQLFELLKKNKRIQSIEIEYLTKNGQTRTGLFSAEFIEIDGQMRFLSMVIDITERKKAEQNLKESEDRFRSLSNAAFEGICVTHQGRPIDANTALLNMFGYDLNEIIGMDVQKLIAPQDWKMVKEKILSGYEKPYEHKALRKDGSIVEVEVCGKSTIYKGKKCRITAVRDITERKEAKQLLQDAKKFSDSLITEMTDGFSVLDNKGVHIRVNPALCRMTGFSSDELIGAGTPHPYWPPEAYHEIENAFQKTKNGELADLELPFMKKNGQRFPVIVSPAHITDEKGNVISYFATVKDITERNKAEHELQRYQQQLKSLASELSVAQERERRRIAAGLHDDVAQKLALAKLETQLMIPSITNEKSLTAMQKQCHLIDSIIEDVRSLTFELGNPILYEVGLDAAVEAWLTERVQNKFGIKCKFASDIQNAIIDETTSVVLFQAVRELLANVIKHANAKNINVEIKTLNDTLKITVNDNGIGFESPEIAAKNQTMGGFGLFNIRERLEQLGGNFVIKSKTAKGTEVTITVPLHHEVIS